MQNYTGKDIGRYHIVERLGQGGMSIVYKALDTRLEREVAINFIRKEEFVQSQQEKMLKRFEREGKSLARMMHPNIVPVYDFGEYEGSPYLVMAYISRGTLREHIGKPMPVTEAARLLVPVARALAYAHGNKVVHRDVKPANILLTELGEPMLSDFGIAKILEGDEGGTLTGTNMAIGSPEYMSPEQGLGKEVDYHADIYSLGVVLYELVTGRKPFIADTPMSVIFKHVSEPLPSPRQFTPGLPEEAERVIFKAMAKKIEERYHDMIEFAAALEKLARLDETVTQVVSLGKKTTLHRINAENGNIDRVGMPPYGDKEKKLSLWFWVGVGGVGLLVLIYGLVKLPGIFPSQRTNTPVVVVATETTLPLLDLAPGTMKMWEKDGMQMMYVPSGEFEMGSNDGSSDERPVHSVYLDAYWIDRTEVSNRQYALCVEVGECITPNDTSSQSRVIYYGETSYANYPVIYVDWNQAKMYCEWVGRRLPTEAEWEKAARGTNGYTYPWGNKAATPELLNYNNNIGDTTAVGKYPGGASPYGALDMAGNVREWVNDWYSEVYYKTSPPENPAGAEIGLYHSLRGSSWQYLGNLLRAADRSWYSLSASNNSIGFRCASSS